MTVIKVTQVEQANINKEQEIIDAEKTKTTIEIAASADKFRVEVEAEAKLAAELKYAEGVRKIGQADADVILAKGTSEAEAEKAKQLASVVAQTTLATEIGDNQKYQDYLIRVKEVDVSQVVEVAKAKALEGALAGADLKIISNAGDVKSGLTSFSDLLSSKGGTAVNGLVESLKHTDEGNVLSKIVQQFMPKTDAE